jgi:hypothetical protein
MIFAGGPGRGLVLLNRVNRQVRTISPWIGRDSDYRTAQNPPLAFSPQDPHVFYAANQFLMETRDDGSHWKKASPDLTERQGSEQVNARETQAATDAAATGERKARTREATETLTPPNRTAINTFSPSPVQAGEIWVGTTNGLVQLTQDGGGTWRTVSPAGLSPFALVEMTEASHFDAATAYIAVDRHEENDFSPHIYVTHDLGKSWVEADNGIAAGDFVRVVREDPRRKGLLYAGTENKAYVSFDGGAHWHNLQLNMPTTSVRDLRIEGDDLVAATYGRSFWILDDVSPLRQIGLTPETKSARPETLLFKPAKALRVQLDLNGDTPLPPEMPAGQNPPNGALIDFYLASAPRQDISLAICDAAGKLVREFSTRLEAHVAEPPPNVPDYWLGHPEPLTKVAGENRFLWDLRYASPDALRHQYNIAAVYGATPGDPLGALVVPGTYEVRLTVGGKVYRQPLEVALDPRVHTSQEALEQQLALDLKATDLTSATYAMVHQATMVREAIAADMKKLQDAEAVEALKAFDAKVVRLAGAEGGRGGGGAPGARPRATLTGLNGEFGSLATVIDSADSEPTPAMRLALHTSCTALDSVASGWNDLVKGELPALNAKLAGQKLSALPMGAMATPGACAGQP